MSKEGVFGTARKRWGFLFVFCGIVLVSCAFLELFPNYLNIDFKDVCITSGVGLIMWGFLFCIFKKWAIPNSFSERWGLFSVVFGSTLYTIIYFVALPQILSIPPLHEGNLTPSDIDAALDITFGNSLDLSQLGPSTQAFLAQPHNAQHADDAESKAMRHKKEGTRPPHTQPATRQEVASTNDKDNRLKEALMLIGVTLSIILFTIGAIFALIKKINLQTVSKRIGFLVILIGIILFVTAFDYMLWKRWPRELSGPLLPIILSIGIVIYTYQEGLGRLIHWIRFGKE